MSGQNHRYTHRWFQFGDMARQEKDDVRWTRTSGDEWDALMERAREALKAYPHSAVGKEGALRDLVRWLEDEQ